jgi:drug/metabolite transporter (DMT)-like permease/proteasome lid subunit RPN8/RPN11
MTPGRTGTGRLLRLGLLYLAVCLIWGTTWYAMKVSVETLPPMTAAGLRFAAAFPFLMGATLASRHAHLLPRPGRRWLLPFVAVVYIAVPYSLINYGEQRISSGLAALLFSSVTVFLVLFSVLISRITVRPAQWIGIVLGLTCLAGILAGTTGGLHTDSLLAPAAVLAAAVMHAFTYAVLTRYAQGVHVLTQETLPIGLGSAALLLGAAVVEHPDLTAVSARSWVGVLYLGLIASVLGFAAYFYLLQHVDAVLLSYIFVLFPVVAVLGSTVLEHASLPLMAVVSALVMLVGFGLTAGRPGGSRAAVVPGEPVGAAGLDDATLATIYDAAVAAYPVEACGFVRTSGRVRQACNIADEAHRRDPGRFERTANTGYVLSPTEVHYLEENLDGPDPVVVLYHSHPNGRAYFSAEDRRNAVIDGEPLYPTLGQLVVGVDDGGVVEARLFRFRDGNYVETAQLPAPTATGGVPK